MLMKTMRYECFANQNAPPDPQEKAPESAGNTDEGHNLKGLGGNLHLSNYFKARLFSSIISCASPTREGAI
jgi:hypothetical protein